MTITRDRADYKPVVMLGAVSIVAGTSMAFALPFGSLFLTNEVKVSPVALGTFLLVSPVASVVASTIVGKLSDARVQRRLLMVAGAVAGAAGYGLFAVLRDYWFLLGASATFVAVASSLLPQIFAYAHQLERSGPFVVTSLRTLISLAWVAGPPLAALLVQTSGFTGLFATTAALYLLVAGLCWVLPPTKAKPHTAEKGRIPGFGLVLGSFTLLQGSTALAVTGLPLFITNVLHGTAGDSGLILGLCAGLEIPIMLWLGAMANRRSLYGIVACGAAFAVAYHAIMIGTGSIWQVAAAQLVHAAAISAIMGVGISYFQSLAPDRPGHASTMFTNTQVAGSMLAGPLLGVAQAVGFRYTYVLSLGMAALGLALLAYVRRSR